METPAPVPKKPQPRRKKPQPVDLTERPKEEEEKEEEKEEEEGASTASEREPTAREWIDSLITNELRTLCYLGGCAPLMTYAKEKHGSQGQGGMTTAQVRAWLKKNPDCVPHALRNVAWHIDHIVPECYNPLGNWPTNFFIMPKTVNLYFGKYLTQEKIKYVGTSHFKSASEFCRWSGLKTKGLLEYKQHDPVTDHFLVQRSR